MNISTRLAVRYIFGKKSTNVINIITAIAMFGIAIGTAALILVLSVFNGFNELITGLFQKFNPDIKITAVKGKTFELDSTVVLKLKALEGVESISCTVEELALFEYKNSQTFGVLKGVDSEYQKVTGIKTSVIEGSYELASGPPATLFVGAGIAQRLALDIDDQFSPLSVYTPKRIKPSPFEPPFTVKYMDANGVFAIQQEFDQEYTLTTLDFAQDFFNLNGQISALEVKLDSNVAIDQTKQAINGIIGGSLDAKDRFRQDEAFLKLMNIEKWMSYAIVCLTLLLVSFNMIGALWMIVLDKRSDISILKALGLSRGKVQTVFVSCGMLLAVLGLILGIIIAIILYILQTRIGLVTIPEGFVVSTYPIALQWTDFLTVSITVLIIGGLASLPAARKAASIPTNFNDN